MKTIIAGGRDYEFKEEDYIFLKSLPITEVVSGCARGADTCGEIFAHQNSIGIKKFPADWNRYGRSAGFIRNKEMAEYAEAVVLFPGGKGTNHMYNLAVKYNLVVYDRRDIG